MEHKANSRHGIHETDHAAVVVNDIPQQGEQVLSWWLGVHAPAPGVRVSCSARYMDDWTGRHDDAADNSGQSTMTCR
jgi:hypothetical protein